MAINELTFLFLGLVNDCVRVHMRIVSWYKFKKIMTPSINETGNIKLQPRAILTYTTSNTQEKQEKKAGREDNGLMERGRSWRGGGNGGRRGGKGVLKERENRSRVRALGEWKGAGNHDHPLRPIMSYRSPITTWHVIVQGHPVSTLGAKARGHKGTRVLVQGAKTLICPRFWCKGIVLVPLRPKELNKTPKCVLCMLYCGCAMSCS